MSTNNGNKIVDPEEPLIERLISMVPHNSSYDDTSVTAEFRRNAEMSFPTIKSADDPCAGFEAIRKRMKDAAKVSGTYRGSVGFIEASIQDILRQHGCIVHGRNFMLAECGMGVHDAAHPLYRTKDGRAFSKKEREENRKKCCRIIGCNANGSGTSKALMAATFLRLGIRCILNVGGCVVVDGWPEYYKDREKFEKNNCVYSYS